MPYPYIRIKRSVASDLVRSLQCHFL